MTPEFAQTLLNRYGAGTLVSLDNRTQTSLATTTTGRYLIALCGKELFEARQEMQVVMAAASAVGAKPQLLELTAYTGKPAHESSLVRKRGMYYCVFRLLPS